MNKILVVVDMQKDFVDGSLGTSEAIAIVDKVASKIASFYGEIIVTYDTHFNNYLDTQEGKMLPVPHCIKGTAGWELNEKVQIALENREHETIEKVTFGSACDLPYLIRKIMEKKQYSIELIGLCTDICVISNALILKANFPETEISVDASCCAGVTPQKHEAALEIMRSCQINVY